MALRRAALIVTIAIAGGSVDASAQSASKVTERYIEAIGGKKAVEQIASTDVSGTVTTADGRSGAFTQRTRRPHSLYVSLSWGGAPGRAHPARPGTVTCDRLPVESRRGA